MAGSTFSIGGGFNAGNVHTGTTAVTRGTAAAGSLASGTNTSLGAIPLNSDQARGFVPLGIGSDVSDVAKGFLVGMRDDHVGRTLDQTIEEVYTALLEMEMSCDATVR
jgi:hypothetical protein